MNVVCCYIDRLPLTGYDLAFITRNWHLFDQRVIFVGDEEHGSLVNPYATPLNVGIKVKTNQDYGRGLRAGLDMFQTMLTKDDTVSLIFPDCYVTEDGIKQMIAGAREHGRISMLTWNAQLYSIIGQYEFKAVAWRMDQFPVFDRACQMLGQHVMFDAYDKAFLIGYLGLSAYRRKMIYQADIWADAWKPYISELIALDPLAAIRQIYDKHREYHRHEIKLIDPIQWKEVLTHYGLEWEYELCAKISQKET